MFAQLIFCPLGYFFEVCSQKYSYWVRGSGVAVCSSPLPGNTDLSFAAAGMGEGNLALMTFSGWVGSEYLTHKVRVPQTVVI